MTKFVELKDMTKEEKAANPGCESIGGYLKTLEYKEAFQKSWDNADPQDRIKIKDLPNFDADIFYEISGIDLR